MTSPTTLRRRRWPQSFSIRAKLMAMIMATTCVALAFAGGALAIFEVMSHRQALVKELSTIADILAENSTASLTFDNPQDAATTLSALASQPDIVSGCLYAEDHRLFASYPRPASGAGCPAAPQPSRAGFVGSSFILYRNVEQKGRYLGTLRLVVSQAQLQERVQLYGVVLLVVLSGAALAALGISSALQRVVSRPILELARTATQISEQRDYALRAPRRSDDEVGVAVAAFNQMLERIEDADRALREASHQSAEAARQLQSLNATLEERVAERTAAAEQRAAELKTSNVELERFAYVASHDLQEPLRAVISYTQLLHRNLEKELDPDSREYLQHVVAGATRMRALINDLLDYSRVGRGAIERRRVPLAEVVDAACQNLAAAIAESGAALSRGPLPEVEGDPGQLTRLLQNLMANAIHFRSEEQPRVTISAEREGPSWKISVADNGIGIEERFHERIFVIFQRLHGRERPGTGIGLAICRKIVDRHGGRIWVESAPGKGSTFHFTLPMTSVVASDREGH